MSNTLINITENGTTTLATSGKYCDRNIDVVVEVAGGGGGGGFELPTELTVNGDSWNINGNWDWCIEAMPNTTINVPSTYGYSCLSMFARCKLTDLSHIHIVADAPDRSKESMFQGCTELTALPVIDWKYSANMFDVSNIRNMFNSCYNLRTIPADFFKMTDENGNKVDSFCFNSSMTTNSAFANCYSLRKLPDLQPYWYSNGQDSTYLNCYCLDELTNIPVTTYQLTSNKFSSTFNGCYRAKNVTFALQDGAPRVVRWKGQNINLSRVGWVDYQDSNYLTYITGYNSGITADKAINMNNYDQLKNDPDAFATDSYYSRYNKVSAIATIASLPDTSAYGTNTITFGYGQGTNTDGGNVATLSEEEIAVATAKGWTVAFA